MAADVLGKVNPAANPRIPPLTDYLAVAKCLATAMLIKLPR